MHRITFSPGIFLLALFLLGLQLNIAQARVEFREFSKPETEARYNKLVDELRCLVCQNQNLKGSNSDLAKDMRNKVFDMISAGKTNQEIADHMVERYGDFVLYKPPFKSITLMLWLGPLLFFIVAIIAVFGVVKSRNKPDTVEELSDEEHQRALKLLKDAPLKKDNAS